VAEGDLQAGRPTMLPKRRGVLEESEAREEISARAARQSGLELVLLHGSRARGEAGPKSDWDLAYLASDGFDPPAFQAELVLALGTDRIDLANLRRANGLLRFRAARDGVVLFEREAGSFERFWMEAVSFWCDAGPILKAGYEAILAELDR
jgi:predicted nucleotidyltransferase